MTQHEKFMQRALTLAEQGLMSARPNPRVGCVIVKDNQIIAEGFHRKTGDAHAEINALQVAGAQADGATCYVTLEPCAHTGKTPPCVGALIAANIAAVVIAMRDPNPLVAGKSIEKLQAAGINVVENILLQQALQLNEGFCQRMLNNRPLVRAKSAMSIDGRTALANGDSFWVTGEQARADVQYWRARSCAVISGVNTVLMDDAKLTVRDAQYTIPEQPLRVVLDTQCRLTPAAKLLTIPGPILLVSGKKYSNQLLEQLPEYVTTAVLPNKSSIDLQALLSLLANQYQCNEVLVEAGATLTGAFWQQNLINEWLVYIAPKLMGDKAKPLLHLPSPDTLSTSKTMRLIDTQLFGQDIRLRYRTV